MKDFLFIVLLVAILLSAGCVSQNTSAASTPTPHVYASTTPQKTVTKGVEQSSSDIQIIGNVYGLSTNNAEITEIRFTIGLTPGASPIDLTEMNIVFIPPMGSTQTPLIYLQGSDTSTYKFTSKLNGVSNVNSMNANDQIEIALKLPPQSANNNFKIELRSYGREPLQFKKTVPATITAKNVLY